jgi:hypothetical protein
MLCILALLPLADSSAFPPAPPLADALVDARMAEPEAVALALTEVPPRINPASAEGGAQQQPNHRASIEGRVKAKVRRTPPSTSPPADGQLGLSARSFGAAGNCSAPR